MPTKPPAHRAPGYRSRKQQLADLDAKRGTSSKRGYDWQWRKLRGAFLAAHPQCCEPGCTERADTVDHIRSIREAPELRLEWSNLRPFCHAHHSARTSRDHSWNRR